MDAQEIKALAKQITYKAKETNFSIEWAREYHRSFENLNEDEAILLEDLVQLYVDYLIYEKHDTKRAKELSNGYIAGFNENKSRR